MAAVPPEPRIDATDRATYAHWTQDKIRFADVDRYSHINNVAFAVYCETGRIEYLEHLLPGSTGGTGNGWLIASLHLQFRAQATYPGTVDIGARIGRIGRSSLSLLQGLFKDGLCFASAESVLVWADLEAGRSQAFPASVRAVLESRAAGGGPA
jgi:acyl-CoA thioester hydrolase